MRGAAPPSWPNKTKSVNLTHDAGYGEKTGLKIEALPLTTTHEGKLRDEAVEARELGERAARTWRETVDEFHDWMSGYDGAGIEATKRSGEVVTVPLENSFFESYERKQYAKICTLESEIKKRYRQPATAMLSLTTTHTDEDGNPRPPVDHLRELKSSWEDVYNKLYNDLRGADWEYAVIAEPHANGLCHLHVAVFVDVDTLDVEELSREFFAPVIAAHVENCEGAGWEAHEWGSNNPEERAISVNDQSDIGNLGAYLAKYMGKGFTMSDDDEEYETEAERVRDLPRDIQRFYALMWATQTRRVRYSQGANEKISEAWERYNNQPDMTSTRMIIKDPAGVVDRASREVVDAHEDPRTVHEMIEDAQQSDVDAIELCECEYVAATAAGEAATLMELAYVEFRECDHYDSFQLVQLNDEGQVEKRGPEFEPDGSDPMTELRPPDPERKHVHEIENEAPPERSERLDQSAGRSPKIEREIMTAQELGTPENRASERRNRDRVYGELHPSYLTSEIEPIGSVDLYIEWQVNVS